MDSSKFDIGINLLNDDLREYEKFRAFKCQLSRVQSLINEFFGKMVDKSLNVDHLAIMKMEMGRLNELEVKLTPAKMKSNSISYKMLSMQLIQDSYYICNWIIEKESDQMDNMFDIDVFFKTILNKSVDEDDSLGYINSLFKGVLKNTNFFVNLSFYGNLKVEETTAKDAGVLPMSSQTKKENRLSQKRSFEKLVIPDEVGNSSGDNELRIKLIRVHQCLKQAVSKNNGQPISFHKFAIDPFSLTFTVENLFHLASLAKDDVIKIEKDPDANNDEFSTLTVRKRNISEHNYVTQDDHLSSLFTINHDLWKFYVEKYNIMERMIIQDD